MADVKISALPAATTPLGGTELVPIVQGGVTTRVSVDNLTAGRTVAASTVNVDANTASAAVRITQTGAGNALLVEDEANPDATPFVVTAAGRVGVGTTTPAYQLAVSESGDAAVSVQSTGTVQTAYVRIVARQSSADDEWNIVAAGSGLGASSLRFVKGGFTSTPSAIITSAGNVGIGTTTPNSWSRLAVQATDATGFTGITSVNSNGSTGIAGIQFASDTTYTKAAIGLVRQAANGAGALVFYNDSASDAANWSPSTDEKMRITSTGNVGIGTTTPSTLLHVNGGNLTVTNPAYAFAEVNSGTVQTQFAANAGTGLDIRAVSNHPMTFYTNNTERMRITSLGNVCIGTTAAGTSAEEVLAIGTGVAPTTGPADTIQIYSTDLSAGNTILSLFTEGTPVNANTTADATHRIAVRINGTVYYLLANTAA